MQPRDQKTLLASVKSHILGRGAHCLMNHPLMVKLDNSDLSTDQLSSFCAIRYNAASQFEPLLAHTLARATAQRCAALRQALHRNLCDERGLDYVTGSPNGQGAHSVWRKDFLDALGITTSDSKRFPLYAYTETDTLPVLSGILLAAEMAIPFEDSRLLKALCASFPHLFIPSDTQAAGTQAQRKASHYLQDHVIHDAARHLPELARAILTDLQTPQDYAELMHGVTRFCAERKALYTSVTSAIGIAA